MVFVTVGTHEQQFNRLVEYMDHWAGTHDEDVVIQTGFSTYVPKNAKWQKLYTYGEMAKYIDEARVVVTHGGPSSFIMPLQSGKIPVVVPRKKKYDEHVNDHQVDFLQSIGSRQDNLIVVDDVNDLDDVLDKYDSVAGCGETSLEGNNSTFCLEFENMVNRMMNAKNHTMSVNKRAKERRTWARAMDAIPAIESRGHLELH